MRTHLDIGLEIASSIKSVAELLQLARSSLAVYCIAYIHASPFFHKFKGRFITTIPKRKSRFYI